MKLEDYKAWLLQHGEIKEEYERPYNPQCDPPSYFLSYAVGELAISMSMTNPKPIWKRN